MNPSRQPDPGPKYHAPYPLSEVERGYNFTNDSGAEYLIGVDWDRKILPDAPFADHLVVFSLIPKSESDNSYDPRIQSTVSFAVEIIFEDDPLAVLFYVCSTEDGQEEVRFRLFKRWFTRYGLGYEKIDFTYEEDRLYMAAIYLKSNPDPFLPDIIKYTVEESK